MSTQFQPADRYAKEGIQKRNFAGITNATTLILKELNFPLRTKRNIVCALQGAANSRKEFKLANLTLARYLEHNGTDGAAKQAAYRDVKALKKFQFENNIILFDIIQGGGLEYKRNEYIDHITDVAIWLYNRSIKEKKSSGSTDPLSKIMLEFVREAAGKLPLFSGSHLEKTFSSKKKKKNEAQEKIFTREEKLRKELLYYVKNFKFSDDSLLEDTKRLSHELIVITESFFSAGSKKVGKKASHSANVSPMWSSPIINSHNSKKPDVPPLQICSPPDHPGWIHRALEYAHRGFSVLPIYAPHVDGTCTCRKGENCSSAGKHPRTRNGVNDATTDTAIIKQWWTQFPVANIGIATGKRSNLICLDVDPRSDGEDSLTELMNKYEILPKTYTVSTGGDGLHFYFLYSPGVSKNSAGLLGNGLDIKTDGGYIVAPPSRHASGKFYEIGNSSPLAKLPEWIETCLINASTPPKKLKHNQPKAGQTVAPCSGYVIPTGNRNERLFKIGCAIKGRNEDGDTIRTELYRVNTEQCQPPLDCREIERIITNVLKL